MNDIHIAIFRQIVLQDHKWCYSIFALRLCIVSPSIQIGDALECLQTTVRYLRRPRVHIAGTILPIIPCWQLLYDRGDSIYLRSPFAIAVLTVSSYFIGATILSIQHYVLILHKWCRMDQWYLSGQFRTRLYIAHKCKNYNKYNNKRLFLLYYIPFARAHLSSCEI